MNNTHSVAAATWQGRRFSLVLDAAQTRSRRRIIAMTLVVALASSIGAYECTAISGPNSLPTQARWRS